MIQNTSSVKSCGRIAGESLAQIFRTPFLAIFALCGILVARAASAPPCELLGTMEATTELPIVLPITDAADLKSIAQEVSLEQDDLLRRIIQDWLSPRRVWADRQKNRVLLEATREAQARAEVLRRWQKFKKQYSRTPTDVATDRFLKRLYWRLGIHLSRGTLYNWDRRFRSHGVDGLIDRRGIDYGERFNTNPFLRELKRLYLLSPKSPSLKACYREACQIAERRNWTTVSYWSAQRYING